ncbi:hypothetical protein TsFJ059_003084 [Trichoderma semiorbis]|uniref:Uncharacterized protein n=1 Tax=Trichoderma semiorbis TaxID=1491008 RepID=A0A9P8HG13_9HYPO|nr:hypothetical protein TsFJ059_003084 [Trichoderma semiorbis]
MPSDQPAPSRLRRFKEQRDKPNGIANDSGIARAISSRGQARWVAIPKDNDDLNEVPPTASERPDKELPSLCVRCEARKWWIFAVDNGRHGLPSRGVIDSDFQRLMYHMMDRSEDRKMAMGMDEMERELLVLFNRHFIRLLEKREQYISEYAHDPLNARIHGFG